MSHPTTVILSVPDSQETQELPLNAVREAVARGEIEPTRWAWCNTQQDWKPISELLAQQPAPVKVPQRAVLAAVVPAKSSPKDHVVKEAGGFGPFKFFVIVLGLAVAAIVGVNYLKVDQPFHANLANTSFSTAPVHAHFGAFVQPDTIVIHLQSTGDITAANLADYLIALASSTPPRPFGGTTFSAIGLTSAWKSQFMITGDDWQALAQLAQAPDAEKKDFILTHMGYPSGERLLLASQVTDPATIQQRREKAWGNLAAVLLPK